MIHNQLYNFLNNNSLLFERPFWFIPKYSTELAYISLSEHLIRQMDAKQIRLNIFLDLSKVFDPLAHDIILLVFYGISVVANKLLKSYLAD